MIDMEQLVSICKNRGFIFQSSEIYGGLGSTWDYGPLGVELKRNVKEAWWRENITFKDNMVGIDAAILMHPKVWEVSGHVSNFNDPLVDCKQCKARFRADHLENDKVCPECGGELTEARQFNCMFKTHMGAMEESAAAIYMRPETAQGIFVNFLNVQNSTRKKLPFGIGQIGKSFRNEITPGNFTFRTREFEQMEIEFFCIPGTDDEWFNYWINERYNWYIKYGINPEHLRLRPHDPEELAFYSKGTTDIEFTFPFGWGELEGIANRTSYDLGKHSEGSGKSLTYFDEEKKEHIIPYVIEPSAGCDRAILAFLSEAMQEEEIKKGDKTDKRIVCKLHKAFAPIKVAVLPLKRNHEEIVKVAKNLAKDMQSAFACQYDDTGSIGKLYRRQDEVGTLWCVTVDFDTIETDKCVTVRDRDTMEQVKVPLENVKKYILDKLND
ncbi:MAG: glycine--tRNA ligase [Armatimonadetes bacterium]|nr:glycine--tRNA ligase [Candidatus Hippobium faecium]